MNKKDESIRRLPDDVVTQIKSSTIITSLEYVVIELVKNALDAGSHRIDVSVDFGRGACTVEDDGFGICSGDFLENGGLGMAFRLSPLTLHQSEHLLNLSLDTSKNEAGDCLHGGNGVFLASLAAMSILKITSHHHTSRFVATLIFHHTRPAARSVPVSSGYQLLNRDHGTKVEVYDLFGNMPVRLKQRGSETAYRKEHIQQWESVVKSITGLLLAWHVPVDAIMRNAEPERKVTVKAKAAAQSDIAADRQDSRLFDLRWICSLLSQVEYLEPNTWESWTKTSARTPFITIRGAFSSQPVESKRTQFISLGIRYLSTSTGANVLYDEVNRIFASSSFGKLEVSSDDDAAKKIRSNDKRFKTDGHTNKQLRGTGKGVDRWPMFVIRIELHQEQSGRSPYRDFLEQESILSNIVKVLGAMVTGFLSDHHFRPRKRRKRQRPASNDQRRSSSVGSGNGASPIAFKQFSESRHAGPRASKSNGDVIPIRGLLGYNVLMPNFRVDRTQYNDEGVGVQSRIKSGNNRGIGNCVAAVPNNPAKIDSVLSDSTPSSRPVTSDNSCGTSELVISRQLSSESHGSWQEAHSRLGDAAPEHGIDDQALRIDRDDIFTWINPMTKDIVSISSCTGLVIPRVRPDAINQNSTASASPAVSGSSANSMFSRCASTPTVPKPGSWLSGFLKDWENPVFAPAMEQDIPRISYHGPILGASDPRHGRGHQCSHLDPEKVFSSESLVLSTKLSKVKLGNARIISQVDKKFILLKTDTPRQDATNPTPGKDDQQVLFLIDQHAADERIRVEDLLIDLCTSPSPETLCITASLKHKPAVATAFLPKPLCFQIKQQEHPMFTAHAQHFANWGILYDLSLSEAGHTPSEGPHPCKITVKALPHVIAERCKFEPKLLIELLRREVWKRVEDGTRAVGPHVPASAAESSEHHSGSDWLTRISTCPQGILDMLNSRSCRSAIMFNDELSLEECEVLVKRLARCTFPFQCAHGRPSMVPLVALGNGVGGETGFCRGGEGGAERSEAADVSFADAWRKWKREKGR
ncbi:MAG: hypothetical protein LQ346_006492 [Caloplaca aetnensis]|nr:MAG: hypothetical protein LQ346_006492 [Caloplaca aetnensis]